MDKWESGVDIRSDLVSLEGLYYEERKERCPGLLYYGVIRN